MARRVGCVALCIRPPKVEAGAIDIAGVSLRGGYFPVVYDPQRSERGRLNEELKAANGMFENGAITPMAALPTGMSKERKEQAAYPIKLDWTVLSRSRWPDHGLFACGRSRLYVHRGTGFYGFPLRIGVPGEASILELLWR